MTLYEVEVRLRVTLMAEDDDTAKGKARSLVEHGCGRLVGSEIVGYVKPAEESGSRDPGAPQG